MNKNVILKSIIRKPVIAILLTLLIGLISYGFVGKAVETILVYRETNRLEGYYRSIGYVTQENPDNEKNPYSAAVELLRQSPELDYDDPQRQTAGFMRDFYNLDYFSGTMDAPETAFASASSWAGEGVYNLDYWFYGRLIESSEEYEANVKIPIVSGYRLIFEVDQVLAGYPENISAGKNYLFWIPARYALDYDRIAPQLEKIEEGERYLIHAWHHPSYNFGVTGLPIAVENASKSFNLKPVDGDQWFIPLGASDSLDLTLPKYTNIKNQIDTLNENLRSILLIGTSDMSAMPAMQLDMTYNYLLEGRWLNHQDELTASNAIVIPKKLAEIRNISTGDELSVTMRALTNPYICYIRGAEDLQNWEDYPNQEITYEVVGIYSNPSLDEGGDLGPWSAISYVPNSTFSDEYSFPTYYSKLKDKVTAYSFLLKNPRMQNRFEEDYAPKLKDLGFNLQFTDNNGKNFVAGADPMRKSNFIGSLLFGLALLMAIALSVFLYLRQQQRNFATMRALGVPAKKSNRQLITPLLALGFIGSALGAAFSWQDAHSKAGESLSQLPLPSGVFPELSLNPWIGIGFWLFVLLVLLFAVIIGNRKVRKTPVLELLQDSNKKAKSKNEESKIEKDSPAEKPLASKDKTLISQS
ncbi:MAG: ABC transporter permease, partial [Smithella sp.]|nr:ABC transporter permease [Smithella sp.]